MKTLSCILILASLSALHVLAAPRDAASGNFADTTPATNVEVQINHSLVLDVPGGFKRVSVANGEVAEAVAITSTQLVVNGKALGETSIVLWDGAGNRHLYNVRITEDRVLIDAVREQLAQELGPDVTLTLSGTSIFLRGTVPTSTAAQRAVNIAAAYPQAKVVNLLRVLVPSAQPQILLKVRFAEIDRSLSTQLGINLFGLDSSKGIGTSGTGQYGSQPTISALGAGATATLTDLLNVMYYRPDINLGAVLEDLEAKNIVQVLAEPNLLTLSGHTASFLAGGEFPFPTIQGGGGGVGQITVQFKEFGIRLNFLPTITPRGTIHMTVMPEVSSLDYANGLTVSGFTVPGLSTKRVTTDIELVNKQSFAIAGLLDNQLSDTIDKMPGFANIPILGNLFKSRAVSKKQTELIVLVTPELVAPLTEKDKLPELPMDKQFLPGKIPEKLGNPTDPLPLQKTNDLPVEELNAIEEAEASAPQAAMNVSGVSPSPNTVPTANAVANSPVTQAPAAAPQQKP